MEDLRYGSATDRVLAIRARYEADPTTAWNLVEQWGWRQRDHGGHRGLKVPRDFSWERFHQGVEVHGLQAEFGRLWDDLLVGPMAVLPVSMISDAICAQVLAPFIDRGPFQQSDFDVLVAPWRAGMDQCVRSRLFFEVASHPPFDRNFWPVVDAVLAGGG